MAVYAAHLTRTLQGTPSIFQVTAQEALGATVKPALKKLIEYLAAVYPDKCGWCERWYDELYLLFDCCLQYHYLKHYAASFSESFYGLVRVPSSTGAEFAEPPRLAPALERASLAALALLPYCRDRLERLAARWREDHEDGKLGKSAGDRLRRAGVVVFGAAQAAAALAALAQAAAYLTARARSPTLPLALLGLSLRAAPPRQPPPDEPSWAHLARGLRAGQLGSVAITFPMVGGAALRAAEYGAFLVQFLRWWEAGRRAAAPLPAPAPPQREAMARRSANRCPLCRGAWRVPTVLPVSGYVFCYACIARHVSREAACPVTRCPAARADLVRLYID